MREQTRAAISELDERRYRQTLGLIRVFALYRVVASATLLMLFRQGQSFTRLGSADPALFSNSIELYSLFNAILLIGINFLPDRQLRRPAMVAAVVMLDIFVITWFTYLSGGIDSGLAPLLLVTVTAGAILSGPRISIFFAASASLALLFEETLWMLHRADSFQGPFQAGVFGALFFLAAQAIQWISARLRASETTALEQAAELADLERINRQVIARMRTGILIVDGGNDMRTGNDSALALLGLRRSDDVELPTALREHLHAWRLDTSYRARPFQVTAETPEIRANFSAVRGAPADAEVIVFLEDTSEVQQRAQQLKLAALGRLSASIAHEIRNPLGAIAHAAQLLAESEHLDNGDARLIDIINNHSERMNGVIENILEMSRRRPANPQRINLHQAVGEFVEELSVADNADAQIAIAIEPSDTEVRIDRSQLFQGLTNLAQNGLRYSRAHSGSPTLRLEGGIDASTDRPFLQVLDDGPGVPEADQASLFEPFFTTEYNGTGLGLYICRELFEANNARLSYVDVPDAGGAFRITFAHPDRITE